MMFLRYILFALMACYWVGLFVLTHLPRVPAVGPKLSDKAAHFIAYGVLAGSLYVTWVVANPRRRRLALIVMALTLAYAAFDELTQPLVGRVCELNDWWADALGAAAALSVLALIRRAVSRADRKAPAPEYTPLLPDGAGSN